jgi:hypothetical protein
MVGVVGVGTKRKFSFKNLKENWRFAVGCVVVCGGIIYLWLK